MIWDCGRQRVPVSYGNVLFITEKDLFNIQCVLSLKDPMTRQLHWLSWGLSENRLHVKPLVYLAEFQISRFHPTFTGSEYVVSGLGILRHELLWGGDCLFFFILFLVLSTNPGRADTKYLLDNLNIPQIFENIGLLWARHCSRQKSLFSCGLLTGRGMGRQ